MTDKQWELIDPLFPVGKSGPRKKGRPRRNNQEVLEGILWIVDTGAPWKDLPGRCPPQNTCHRRFQEWVNDKTLEHTVETISRDLEDQGGLNLQETFIDSSFSSAKKGGFALVQPNAKRAPGSWQLSTAMVFLSPYASK